MYLLENASIFPMLVFPCEKWEILLWTEISFCVIFWSGGAEVGFHFCYDFPSNISF